MAEWYLATYQNSVFSSDLGIIQPSGDYVYKLKNGIQSGESPVKSDWLRISITDNTVEEWDNSNWADPDEGVTGLVNGSIYWVYGSIVKYAIVTNSQVYYLKSFSNNHNEDTNTRIITGKDINNSDVIINDLRDITAVTIGPSVTEIGKDAFYYCTSLKTVSIPDSVTSIGDDAFRYCSSLGSTEHPLIIPDSVTSIGNYAFEHCYNLASLIIGKKVDTIGKYAFSYCTKLLTLNIPDSVKNIGQYAFQWIGDSFNDDPIITISQTVLGNLNTNYNLELTHGTGQSFFGASVTLQVPA